MTYEETLNYLYAAAPLFQQVGGEAYKAGLQTTLLLDAHFKHPHRRFRTLHVAGTNGKGSCAHTLAAMLQHAGLRTGLYTSPHLLDFRERIRVNGEMMPEQYVIDFVENERSYFEPLRPSFFELTTALAFQYFADARVDVAVIEVGLGGRMDCTNIISPEISLITNISFDHTQFLGNTLAKIAREKAGIMKPGVPCIVGEANEETRPVFEMHAQETGTPLYFAEDKVEVLKSSISTKGLRTYETRNYGTFDGELVGECQVRNTNTLLCAARFLKPLFGVTNEDIRHGFRHVCDATHLMGRWQIAGISPLTVCDTGHNAGGWKYLAHQLHEEAARHPHLHIVFGMAADKDIKEVLSLLPSQATYYWTQASVRRALPASEIASLAANYHLQGTTYNSVPAAYAAARTAATAEDFIYIGGSNFIVADFLAAEQEKAKNVAS